MAFDEAALVKKVLAPDLWYVSYCMRWIKFKSCVKKKKKNNERHWQKTLLPFEQIDGFFLLIYHFLTSDRKSIVVFIKKKTKLV